MTQQEYWDAKAEDAEEYASWCRMYARRVRQNAPEPDCWRVFQKLAAAAKKLRESLPK
jgi:hypothetical protein